MKNLWNIADLIDLHLFFQIDEELRQQKGEAALAKRDRIIYLAKIEPQLGKADDIPPRLLVRKWLSMRRLQFLQEKDHKGMVLPGAVWREMVAICRVLFFLGGLLTGVALAGSLLIYAGSVPLNVSLYFGLCVLSQLFFLGLQSLFLIYRRFRRIPMESTVLYVLIGRLLVRGLDGLRRRLQRKMSGRQRLDLAALIGGVHHHRELAALFIWPAFMLVQLGGIGFNLGVFGATLAKVAFADIAFGWQSSLQLSAEAVARLVQWIALPWSWVVPHAYPSLEQIKGSQMVLKEGMAHLATSDLISWWPFLCSAVVVYGLLPRLALLGLGMWQQLRALDRLHFATLGIRPLLQRMAAARIDTNGITVSTETPLATPFPDFAAGVESVATRQEILQSSVGGPWFVLIPDELYEDCSLPELIDLLGPGAEASGIESIRYGTPGILEAESLAPLINATVTTELSGVLLLQDAWQPPLQETGSFLQSIRRVVGETVPIAVLLIGKPSSQTIFTPVNPEHLRIWELKMRAIGDPCLDVIPLMQP